MAASPFRPALDLMAQYAMYHRDKRNIVTHFVGIPLIVFAIGILLARASVVFGVTLAWIFWALVDAVVPDARQPGARRGHQRGQRAADRAGPSVCRHAARALAVVGRRRVRALGWVIQFVGHYYEGRKPAFVDDLVGLLVGPMFVVGGGLFALGWGHDLLAEIERRAGPTHLRDLAAPATR